MSIKKYLSLERLSEYDALLKAKIAQDDAATLGAAKEYTDGLIEGVNTSITNITNGDVVVKEAEHATSADSATSAESATKATQDGNGAVIADTYETKTDAAAKLTEAKEYVDGQIESHVHSWNDLEDKPTEFVGGRTFNKSFSGFNNYGFKQVSDIPLSLEDFANGYTITLETGEILECTADDISIGALGALGSNKLIKGKNNYIVSLPEEYAPSGMTFPKGVYFYNSMMVREVTVRGNEEKLKEDIIPDTIARVSDIPEEEVVIFKSNASLATLNYTKIKEAIETHKTVILDYEDNSNNSVRHFSTPAIIDDGGVINFTIPTGSGVIIASISNNTKVSVTNNFTPSKHKLNSWDAEKTGSTEYFPSVKAMEEYVGGVGSSLQTDVDSKLDEVKTYVGTIPETATATDIVGYVQEKTAGIASEGAMTELSNRVGAIEGDYLKIADKTELQGNINTVSSAVELLTNGVNPETVDGVNDLIAYVNEHGSEVTGMKSDIKTNADAIASLATIATTGSWNDLEDKPFYENKEVILPETTIDFEENYQGYGAFGAQFPVYLKLNQGIMYDVVFDGELYSSIESGGNDHIVNPDAEDNGLPFCFGMNRYDQHIFTNRSGDSHTVEVIEHVVTTLDEKYIPNTIARVEDQDILEERINANDNRIYNLELKASTLETNMSTTDDRVSANETAIGDLNTAISGKVAQTDFDEVVDVVAQLIEWHTNFDEISAEDINGLFA